MRTVAGVFQSRADAEHAVEKLQMIGLSKDRIVLLIPGGNGQRGHQPVPTSQAEQPGMARVLGTVVGGAVGAAGGLHAGAVASAAIPGVGAVLAVGFLGAAVLGFAGAGIGAAAGQSLDDATTEGLPADELFVYEDALRRGRSVVLAFVEGEDTADSARREMAAEGVESINDARDQWWIGLRSAEQEHYMKLGGSFEQNETFYRMGFEAALNARRRRKEYAQVQAEVEAELKQLRRRYPDADVEEPFRRGYERGCAYDQSLCDSASKNAA